MVLRNLGGFAVYMYWYDALIDFIPKPWNFKLSRISDQRQMGRGKQGSPGLGSTIW